VQIVWRADITEADVEQGYNDKAARERLLERLEATPPGALEAMSLPVWVAQRWLMDTKPDTSDEDMADVDGQRAAPERQETQVSAAPIIVWRGRRRAEIRDASDLPPGALVVVPAQRGGIGLHGTFDPEYLAEDGEPAPVPDLGDGVQLLQRGRPSLRLDARVIGRWVGEDFEHLLGDPADETFDVRAGVRGAINSAGYRGA
jgi:hypothetical protein